MKYKPKKHNLHPPNPANKQATKNIAITFLAIFYTSIPTEVIK